MTTVPMESVPFSELLREPGRTAARLTSNRFLLLRRRNEADLALMTAERAQAETRVVDITGRVLALLTRTNPDLVSEVLPVALPWTKFLPPAGLAEFTTEFVETVRASADLGNTAPIWQLIVEWEHTAEVYADPDLFHALTETPTDDFGPVPRPESAD